MQADFSWIYFDAFFALLCDIGKAGVAGAIAAHCKYRAENATKLKKNTIHLNELQVPERLPSGDIEAIFSLADSDYTFSMWQVFSFFSHLTLNLILNLHQHQFRISYRIILREKELHLNIGVYNPSKVVS